MEFRFFQVDAFTNRPFGGNPAAVCIADQLPADEVLSRIGKENNVPMTAFIVRKNNDFILRWFRPDGGEAQLCGHATLASAHILWETGMMLADEEIRFHTVAGRFTATKGNDGWITLNFPAIYGEASTDDTLKAVFPTALEIYQAGKERTLVLLPTEEEVRNFKPEHELLQSFCCIVTAKATTDKPYDFVSRFFAAPHGLTEDPVTGSAHCVLAPYWAAKLGKTTFNALQVSAREGELRVALNGDKVALTGQALTLIDGWFRLPA
ncbi:PhzF family phenazine biosynthesis protein [Chitinophaga sp. Hz27]|uniref:PhzF family phenazine biosynthesis protein n=1 Tax=Chitinophaga sp. Hz27 TaxID=3347169 RepID=UPI0035D87816